MRTFVLIAAFVALASAAATYTPPKRGCHWSVELFQDGSNKVVYDYNGLFYAKTTYSSSGDKIDHLVYRPDINNGTSYRFQSGKCSKVDAIPAAAEWLIDRGILASLGTEQSWYGSEDAKFRNQDCTKFYDITRTTYIYVNKGNSNIIGGKLLGFSATEFKCNFGSGGAMSAFALSKANEQGCADDAYKAGNDKFAFCAAYSTKAALALVLAAIATALLSLF